MAKTGRTVAVVFAAILTMLVTTQSATAQRGAHAEAHTELVALERELMELRKELATARLELNQTLEELREIQQFLAAADPETQIEQWEAQRAELAAERAALATAQRQMERQTRLLRDAARAGGGGVAPVRQDPNRPQWKIDYRLATIPLENNRGPLLVRGDPAGEVFIDVNAGPRIDRENVIVRGTFQNTSAATHRYTFEIRIADSFGNVIGTWRYQTPILTADELHEFSVKVPVADVSLVRTYQIGNIRAQRIDPGAPGAPGGAPGGGAAGGGAAPGLPDRPGGQIERGPLDR